jgi:hypothetical protein
MSNHSKRTFGSVDAATTSDKQPVLAPIQALFDGIAQRDKSAMLKVLLPDGGATIIRNGQILQFNLRALVERLAARTERSEERIYDSFNLVRRDERWLIAGVANNSRPAATNVWKRMAGERAAIQ